MVQWRCLHLIHGAKLLHDCVFLARDGSRGRERVCCRVVCGRGLLQGYLWHCIIVSFCLCCFVQPSSSVGIYFSTVVIKPPASPVVFCIPASCFHLISTTLSHTPAILASTHHDRLCESSDDRSSAGRGVGGVYWYETYCAFGIALCISNCTPPTR